MQLKGVERSRDSVQFGDMLNISDFAGVVITTMCIYIYIYDSDYTIV